MTKLPRPQWESENLLAEPMLSRRRITAALFRTFAIRHSDYMVVWGGDVGQSNDWYAFCPWYPR